MDPGDVLLKGPHVVRDGWKQLNIIPINPIIVPIFAKSCGGAAVDPSILMGLLIQLSINIDLLSISYHS
jgi:hypothetical protein